MNKLIPQNQGFIALMGVLLVGAIGVAAVLAVIQLGVEYTQLSLLNQQEQHAKAYADACSEDALESVRSNISFTGTTTLSFSFGVCSSVVINTGGSTREIDSMGTVGTIVKRVKVLVSALNPQITVSSWQEVSSF